MACFHCCLSRPGVKHAHRTQSNKLRFKSIMSGLGLSADGAPARSVAKAGASKMHCHSVFLFASESACCGEPTLIARRTGWLLVAVLADELKFHLKSRRVHRTPAV